MSEDISTRGPDDGKEGRLFRWQALLQRVSDPFFVLDRRRRLLFVNRAWEQLTGFSLDRVRGLVCNRPRPVAPDDSQEDQLAHFLTPPREATRGSFARLRRWLARLAPQQRGPCDIEFFPLRLAASGQGHLLLGRLLPSAVEKTPVAWAMLPERLEAMRQRQLGRYGLDLLQSVHRPMHRLEKQVRLAMQTPGPVLLVGEPGSGKSTIARIIHYNGPNRDRALAVMDASRLPALALADVLRAERQGPLWSSLGAIYLAAPSHLPREMQQQLCDWLRADPEQGPRLFLGTGPGVEVEVRAGRLLPELYWQSSVLTIEVPPLRSRLDDLPMFVEQFLRQQQGHGRRVTGLTPAAWELLRGYNWPGNLTELRRVLVQAGRRSATEQIDVAHLPTALRQARDRQAEQGRIQAVKPMMLEEVMAEVERRLIQLALTRARGNRTKAAELLGMARQRLLRRMEALGLGDQVEAQDES